MLSRISALFSRQTPQAPAANRQQAAPTAPGQDDFTRIRKESVPLENEALFSLSSLLTWPQEAPTLESPLQTLPTEVQRTLWDYHLDRPALFANILNERPATRTQPLPNTQQADHPRSLLLTKAEKLTLLAETEDAHGNNQRFLEKLLHQGNLPLFNALFQQIPAGSNTLNYSSLLGIAAFKQERAIFDRMLQAIPPEETVEEETFNSVAEAGQPDMLAALLDRPNILTPAKQEELIRLAQQQAAQREEFSHMSSEERQRLALRFVLNLTININRQLIPLMQAGLDVNQPAGGQYLLNAASLHNRTEAIPLLLNAGAEVNSHNRYPGNTPLHEATQLTHTRHPIHGPRREAEVTQMLLDAGAEVNLQNRLGQTPLYIAAMANNTDTMRLLLAAGANPTLPTTRGQSPLRVAELQNAHEAAVLLRESI